MPLFSLLCVQLFLSAVLAWVSSEELRASTRAPWRLKAARWLYFRECFSGIPALSALWAVHGDWLLGYRVHAQTLPSLVSLVGLLLPSVVVVLGYFLCAGWIRSHHSRWVAAFGGIALVGSVVLGVFWRGRWSAMTSTVQFRGAFGPEPGWTGGALAGILGWVFFWGLSAFLLAIFVRLPEEDASERDASR